MGWYVSSPIYIFSLKKGIQRTVCIVSSKERSNKKIIRINAKYETIPVTKNGISFFNKELNRVYIMASKNKSHYRKPFI